MSEEISLQLENGDIVFNGNNQLILIQDNDNLAQQYKILLETQFESDYRDPTYGFRLLELFQVEKQELQELIRLYVIETLLQHPKTSEILEVNVIRLENRNWNVIAKVKIKPTEEIITVGSELSV